MENINTKKLVDELIEDNVVDKDIIKTFYSKGILSPVIFELNDDGYSMKKEIREKLIEIADTFIETWGASFFVYDIILTGSLSNYNWSKFSDVDLHIIIDMNEYNEENTPIVKDMIKDYFDTKKTMWNDSHDIRIKNYEVEVYVQDIDEENISSGMYSILNNKWIIDPQKEKHSIDDNLILKKGKEYSDLIDGLIKKSKSNLSVLDDVENLKDKIKKFRRSGLEKGGEYSYENLTFKLLRRNGYIEKLFKLKKELESKKMSITQ